MAGIDGLGGGFGAGLGGESDVDDFGYSNQPASGGYESELSAEQMIAEYNSTLTGTNAKAQADTEATMEALKASHAPADGTGGITSGDLQAFRFGQLSESQIHLAINILEDKSMNFDTDTAVETFTNVTGESPAAMAGKMKTQLRRSGYFNYKNEVPTTEGVTPYGASRSQKDRNMILSMMGTTAENYEVSGAGGRLTGNVDGQNIGASAEGLVGAYQFAQTFADTLIDPRVSREGARYSGLLQDTTEAVINQMVTGTGYKGQDAAVPLPNELRIDGLIPTIGKGRNPQGTPFTTMGFAIAEARGELSSMGDKAFFMDPSRVNTFFPIQGKRKDYTDAEWEAQKLGKREQFNEFRDQYFEMKEQFVDSSDEAYGNKRTGKGFRAAATEYERAQNIRERISVLGLDWADAPDDPGATPSANLARVGVDEDFVEKVIPAGQRLEGSQNMSFGHNYGLSSSAEFEQKVSDLMYDGTPMDAAIDMVMGDYEEPSLDTAQSRYLASAKGRAVQGSAAWKAERRGLISASTASLLDAKDGISKMALTLKREQMGYHSQYPPEGSFQSEGFVGNDATGKGNRQEQATLQAFLATQGKGLTYEEAFFETNPKLPGFGASPDGRLFNPDGSSAGLLELKTLQKSTYRGSTKKYNDQMQLQMAVTGESQVHFFARDQYGEAGDYEYNVVQYDQSRVDELLESGQTAIDLAGGLSTRKEVQELQGAINANKRAKRVASRPNVDGEKFNDKSDIVEEVMTALKEDDIVGPPTKQQALGKRLLQQVLDSDSKDVEDLSFIGPQESDVGSKARKKVAAMREGKEVDAHMYRLKTGDEVLDEATAENKRRDAETSKSHKELAESSFKASKMINHFAASARKAAAIFSGIGAGMTGKTEDVLDEGRLAARVGMSAEELRGTRVALRSAQLTDKQIDAAVGGAGDLVSGLNTPLGIESFVESTYAPMMAAIGDNPELAHLEMGSIDEWRDLDNRGVMQKVSGMMAGLSPEMRKVVGNALPGGLKELAFAADQVQGVNLATVMDKEIDIAGGRRVAGGMYEVQRGKQLLGEAASTTTGSAGMIGEGFKTIGDFLSIDGVSQLIGGALSLGGEALGETVGEMVTPNKIEGLAPTKAQAIQKAAMPTKTISPVHTTDLVSKDIGPIAVPGDAPKDKDTVQNFDIQVNVSKDGTNVQVQDNGNIVHDDYIHDTNTGD